MHKFTERIEELSSLELIKSNFFLWIWNPDQKSPHLGVSINGYYTSLQAHGKQENISVKSIMGVMRRKKNKLLMLQLTEEVSQEKIKIAFQPYVSCLQSNCSCSKPLFDLFNVDKSEGLLFDILDKLESEEKIKKIYSLNLSADFQGIPAYDFKDVQLNLERLLL